jgi:hypothetical protein
MRTADAENREVLAKGYEDVQFVLKVHLRREVTEVMPAVDRVITEEELKAMWQHGVRQHDKKFLVTYLGMILATNPPEDRRAIFYEEIPAPARLGCHPIGRRMHRKQIATLFPGRPILENSLTGAASGVVLRLYLHQERDVLDDDSVGHEPWHNSDFNWWLQTRLRMPRDFASASGLPRLL